MDEFINFFKQYFYFDPYDRWGVPLLIVFTIFLFVAETAWQLRKRKISRWKRIKTNVGIAATAVFALRVGLIPALVIAAKWAEGAGVGLLNWVELPHWLVYALGFVLLDYGNYLWHVLNHKWAFLWRFHNVHHIDLDLDVTTAVRFHFGEVLLSVVFRGLIILAIGAPYLLVLVYEVFFEASTNFHHTNWRIPFKLEKVLNWFIVTPRMHGIHHSIVQRETNSNYSIIFNFWDRLHRTIRLNIRQDEIDIGVPSYRDPKEQTIKKLLIMPFRTQRPWQLPDGQIPGRKISQGSNSLQP